MAKSARKENVYLTCQFFPEKLCILPNRNPQICVKTINQNLVPNQTEITKWSCVADKHRIFNKREVRKVS